MAGHMLAVVCAWCNRIVTQAAAGADVSHTICASCSEWSIQNPTSRAGCGTGSDLEELQELPADYGQGLKRTL